MWVMSFTEFLEINNARSHGHRVEDLGLLEICWSEGIIVKNKICMDNEVIISYKIII